MDEGVQKFTEAVTSSLWIFGGVQVVVVSLAAWLGKVWMGRVSERERRRTEESVERLRHELRAMESMTAATRDAFAFGSQVSHERRLQAAEALWVAVLKLRVSTNLMRGFHDVPAKGEHEAAIRNPENELLKDCNWKTVAELAELGPQIEMHRPFLSERLWDLFFAYSFVLMRSCVVTIEALRGEPFVVWYDDPGIRQILGAALTEREQADIFSERFPFASCVDILERKILGESERIISGRRAGEEALDREQELARTIRSLPAELGISSAEQAPQA
ncbi:MAG: hypothetical protein HYR72_13835 [Deltaproteobacteria bacterium]|nr:hypothetical protein [Deltaproteobacteria bacterium]MBI3391144.1 hypothetical protein [Deltaproteobacteria bacterium]